MRDEILATEDKIRAERARNGLPNAGWGLSDQAGMRCSVSTGSRST